LLGRLTGSGGLLQREVMNSVKERHDLVPDQDQQRFHCHGAREQRCHDPPRRHSGDGCTVVAGSRPARSHLVVHRCLLRLDGGNRRATEMRKK
jgi:hypothetical protein